MTWGYPVVRVEPTGSTVVATRPTLAEAREHAALLDATSDNFPTVWHHADSRNDSKEQ